MGMYSGVSEIANNKFIFFRICDRHVEVCNDFQVTFHGFSRRLLSLKSSELKGEEQGDRFHHDTRLFKKF